MNSQPLEALQVRIEELEKRFAFFVSTHRDTHTSEDNSIDRANAELNHWKSDHNNLQRQLANERKDFIGRDEHESVLKKIDAVQRLVYIGLGIAIAVSALIQFLGSPHH